ncbi:unnamed protein product, partial [Allacma fusca]
LHSPAPFNPNPQSHHSVAFQPQYGQAGVAGMSSSTSAQPTAGPGHRNRNPLSVQSVISGYPSQRSSWDYPDLPPPPLPPRSFSQSFSSADHSYNPPGYSVHDPLGHELGQAANLNSTNSHSSGLGHKSYLASTNNDVSFPFSQKH